MSERPDIAFLDTMNEVLEMTAQFVEEARQSKDDVRLGAYLKMASRCMRCALEMYSEHLAQNRAEMEQGERNAKVQSDADPDGRGIHGFSPASWIDQ
jgi:hypothetical protein